MTINLQKNLNRKIELLRDSSLFNDLKANALSELASLCTLCSFKKGELIYQEGSKPEFVYIFQRGKIKYFTYTVSGKAIVAAVNNMATICGISNMVTGDPNWLSTQALDNMVALKIHRKYFIGIMRKNPILAFKIQGVMEQFLHSGFNRFKSAVSESAEQRVYDIIYDLHEKFGSVVPFSDEDIAFLVGITRESTVRAISRLRTKGIVKTNRGSLHILDHAKLYKIKQEYPVI